MSKRHQAEEVRNVIGALDFAGVNGVEIHRRLRHDEAGLGRKVDIGQRQVYNHIQAYRAVHGEPPHRTGDPADATLDTIEKLEGRLIAIVAREITAAERKGAGRLSTAQHQSLRQAYVTAKEVERQREYAENRKRKRSSKRHNPPEESGKPEARDPEAEALEKLVEEIAA
jgi:hypothetical protein